MITYDEKHAMERLNNELLPYKDILLQWANEVPDQYYEWMQWISDCPLNIIIETIERNNQ